MENLVGYLEVRYAAKAKEWENEVGDKGEFSKLYHQMIEALNLLYGCDNMYIRVAMHKAIANDEMRLQDILRRQ